MFAEVVEGMDVANDIAAVAVSNQGPYQGVPVDPVVIEDVHRR